jgi:hypothetical protein
MLSLSEGIGRHAVEVCDAVFADIDAIVIDIIVNRIIVFFIVNCFLLFMMQK